MALVARKQVEPEVEEIVIEEVIIIGWLWVVVVHVVIIANRWKNEGVRELVAKEPRDARMRRHQQRVSLILRLG